MTAPSATNRQAPAGRMLDDGYQSLITFAVDPDVAFWEKGVQPPGIDGGEKIDVTTMHNTTYRTSTARSLKEVTDGQVTAAWDPRVYPQIIALINVETTITVKFSNGDTLAFYGYLQKFEPSELKEGEHPEATLSFVATNRDPSTGAEEAPVLTEVAGTGT